ncbi:hypothetical protein D3C87_2055520 [compost metagenome]
MLADLIHVGGTQRAERHAVAQLNLIVAGIHIGMQAGGDQNQVFIFGVIITDQQRELPLQFALT